MANKILIYRGTKATLPALAAGELALCTDTKEVYIGTDGTASGNVRIDAGAADIPGTGSGDMLKSEYDADGDGIVDEAAVLATAQTINGIEFDGSAAITNYGVCSTAAGTAAKTVALAGFKLATGAVITVKFNNANTHASPTLNVNSTGAKNMLYKSTRIGSALQCILAGGVYSFVYNGSNYQLISDDSKAEIVHTHTAEDVGAVPVTRKINGKEISEDVSIVASDIGISFSTVDLTAGTSPLDDGCLYFVYE